MRHCFLLAVSVLPILLAASPQADQAPPTSPERGPPPAPARVRTLGILLYDRFELLDVFGPAEMFGNVGPGLKVLLLAEKAGPVASTQGPRAIADHGFDDSPTLDILLVPGGAGTLEQLSNPRVLEWLKKQAASAELVLSVCSGSALLAQVGLLDERKATCNKQFFRRLTDPHRGVQWVVQARWVEDGKWITSSGVSAGMDMALAVIERLYGKPVAEAIADGTEYERHRDASWDPFSRFVK